LLLIHVGRPAGLRRHTVLEVMKHRKEGAEVVLTSGFGPNADWLRNVRATPDPGVFIGSRHFAAAHRVPDGQ
jgi:deazaflavin-dependent oxidoreductase (nitroreductase family)